LSDQQRVKVQMLKAEALLLIGQYDQVVAILTEVEQRYGEVADPGETKLLLARAKLKINTDGSVAEALKLLEMIVDGDAETPAGRAAQLELALFRLSQDLSKANADAVKDWVSAYGDHPDVDRALRTMMEAYLQLSQERSAIDHAVRMDIRLNELDREALAAAEQMYRRYVRAEQTEELTGYLMANLIEPYRDRFAYVAAADGCQAILEMSLTPASRLRAMLGLAEMQRHVALAELWQTVRAGQQIGPEMPQSVLDALATVDAIRAEFPGEDRDRKWALALAVREAGAHIAHPAKVTELRPTDAWALQVMLDVLGKSGSRDIKQGCEAVWQIIMLYGAIEQQSAKQLAIDMADQLLEVVPKSFGQWPNLAWRSIELRASCAEMQFRRNIVDGLPQANAELTDKQAELIGLMAAVSTVDRSEAERLLVRLEQHLALWTQHGHYDAARSAYGLLAESLPLDQRRRAELSQVRLTVLEVQREFQRRLSAGMSVPAELDPRL
ncbi:MAG: hypothetical protein KAU28_04680, partial [Phycisphaerae bacterium]|nr:hypothetical protein [Phycisphaerae bacterium]